METAPSPNERIRWASKVPQARIWQIYQDDANGMPDEERIADVGERLLRRCRSIQLATARSLECPRCGAVIHMAESEPWRLLPGPQTCPSPNCGWSTTREEWHASWAHRDLLGAAALPAVETYLRDYPRAADPQQRMLAIDQLIHAFHISLTDGQVGRSFANNLIEGSHKQVVDLLDRLFALPGGVPKEEWRAAVGRMWQRRQGQPD